MSDEPKLHRTHGLGSDKTISLKVTQQMDDAIEHTAKASEISKSEWIREQIRRALGGTK